MGAWLSILLEVTSKVSVSGAPLAEWFKGFEGACVRRAIGDAVAARNRSIGHGASIREGAYDTEEEVLLDALAELMRGALYADLLTYRAVAVFGARVNLDSDAFDYVIVQASGVGVDPRPRSLRTTHRLGEGWLYLVDEHSRRPPLRLSPFFYVDNCRTCGQREVFAASRPVLGPKGAVVELEGITTGHRASAPIAWDAHAQALWSTVSVAEPEP
jgi:hypothetical protein